MSKSLIYAGSKATQTVTTAGVILSFDNIVRRYGQNLELSGGNIVTRGSGYYETMVNVTATASADAELFLQVYKDGVAVPYANTTINIPAGEIAGGTIPCVIRECGCGCNCSTITVIASGAAASVTNASIMVTKE